MQLIPTWWNSIRIWVAVEESLLSVEVVGTQSLRRLMKLICARGWMRKSEKDAMFGCAKHFK